MGFFGRGLDVWNGESMKSCQVERDDDVALNPWRKMMTWRCRKCQIFTSNPNRNWSHRSDISDISYPHLSPVSLCTWLFDVLSWWSEFWSVCSLIILKLPTVTSVHCVLEMLRRAWAQDSTQVTGSDTKWNTRCATRWSACSDFSAIYQWLSGQLGRNCQRSRGHQMQSPEIAIWKAQELNSSFIYESMIYIYIFNYIRTYIHGRICMCLFVPWQEVQLWQRSPSRIHTRKHLSNLPETAPKRWSPFFVWT